MNIPRWSVRNPTLVLLAVLLFSIWGLGSYLTISRREDPEIKISVALVVTPYPGASAEKVEEQVTRKLEDRLEGLVGLDHLFSTTRANISVIFVALRYETDTELAWQKLRARVSEARRELPEGILGPQVIDNFGDTTSMLLALTGAPPTQLRRVADALKVELRTVPSVGDVTIYGELPETIYLEAGIAELARSGLTPHRMMQALQMRNLKIPAGAVRSDRYAFRVEPSGAYRSVREIEDTILDVSKETGQPLHVRDLFTVRRTLKDPPDVKLLTRGETAVAVGIVMRKGENVVAMGRAVREAIARFQKQLPPGLKLEVLHDSPRQVDERVGSFMRNLLEGLVIVVLCMGIFMGLRAALISATAIPLSVLAALALMPLTAVDLELVSIAAFIVALGMLVDDNIIVVDNIDVKLREGMPPEEAAWRGTHELTIPVIVGTLGNVFAFFPMLLLSRETGAYIRSLPIVLSYALGASMLIAFSAAPLAARALMRRPKRVKVAGQGRAAQAYRRFLRGCLRHRALVVLASLASLAGAAALLVAIGFSFFPEAERDQLTVDIWLKEGTSLEETERVARRAEADLLRDRAVASTLVYVGTGAPRFYITLMPEFQTANFAQIIVNARRAEDSPGIVERFNARARTSYPGARVFARKLIMGMPIEAPIALRLSGPELGTLRRLSAEVQAVLRATPGTDQVRDNVGDDVPSLHVEVDGERANRIGITHTDVALAFLSTHQGLELTRFTEDDKEIPVVLRLRDEERKGSSLAALPVASSLTGEKVPLSSVASVEPRFGPGVIRHHNGRRSLTVLAWTTGNRLANDVLEGAWSRLQAIRLPPGYRLTVAGEKEEMDRAFRDLLVVFAVILALLLGLLALQLGTLRRVVVVLVAVPLSLVGAALGLFLGGYSFSFMAFLGVVSLAGMVIKNGVVWIEFVERAREAGRPREEAVIEAGIARLRPILLTAATTLGGLLPLGLFGGVLFEPMAWAMIAGLGLATVLTLVVVPVFYTLLVPASKPAAPSV